MPESKKAPIELIPKSFTAGSEHEYEDKRPFELRLIDQKGKEYSVIFLVNNAFIDLMNKAIRRMVPAKRITT
jgi:hypothetical protein